MPSLPPPPCAFSTRFLLLVSLYYASPSLQYFQISAAMIFLPSPPPPPPTKQSVVRSHTHARAHILINTPTPVSSSSTHPFIGFFFFSFSLPFRFSKIESLSDTIRRGESKIEEEEEGEEAKEGNFSLAKLGFLFFFFLRGQQANRAERCWGGGGGGKIVLHRTRYSNLVVAGAGFPRRGRNYRRGVARRELRLLAA